MNCSNLLTSLPSSLTQFLSQWVSQNYQNGLTLDSPLLSHMYQLIVKKYSFPTDFPSFQAVIKELIQREQSKSKIQPENNLFHAFPDDQKNNIIMPKIHSKKTNFTSKRKISPSSQAPAQNNLTLQMRLKELQRINNDCIHSLNRFDRKNNKKLSMKETQSINEQVLWFYHEYFYSTYDRKYFSAELMGNVIEELGYDFRSWTFKDHLMLLRTLPKPSIFRQEFIQKERINLQKFRNKCRQVTKNLSKTNDQIQLSIQSVVLALHPNCGHLHTGSILAVYKENQYMVRFIKPDLPAQKILDISMSTQFTTSSSSVRKLQQIEKDRNYPMQSSQVTQSLNYDTTALLIKLLTLKSEFLIYIRTINDNFEESEQTNFTVDVKQKDIQQWLIEFMEKLDKLIKTVLIRFRLRGVNESNSAIIYGNLRTLLISPLKLMSKQFENNGDQIDMNASAQIKSIIQKQREVSILQAKNQLTKTMANITESEYLPNDEIKKRQMSKLLRSCMGILSDLKYEGKTFDVENNQNLLQLSNTSGETNAEEFNQIYQKLYSIINKIRD